LVLADGDTFAVFDSHGEIEPGPGSHQGLYADGTRFLSGFAMRIGGHRPLLLSSGIRADNAGLFVHEANPDVRGPDRPHLPQDLVHLTRRMSLLDDTCLLEPSLRSYASSEIVLPMEVWFEADYADVFEVRGSTRERRGKLLDPR